MAGMGGRAVQAASAYAMRREKRNRGQSGSRMGNRFSSWSTCALLFAEERLLNGNRLAVAVLRATEYRYSQRRFAACRSCRQVSARQATRCAAAARVYSAGVE